MLALQNAPVQASRKPEPPAANTTNANSQSQVSADSSKPLPNIDGLSNQILSLTSIATALQKDIAQLSRRSRDNATDLLSLKEATNARDEDIRRSLREVITNFRENPRLGSREAGTASLLLDNQPHHHAAPPTIPKGPKPYTLPRIPSLTSLTASIDRDSLSTPSLCSHDTPGTIVILERILKDMGTKEGNELLLSRVAQISERITSLASADQIEKLIDMVKLASEEAVDRTLSPNENRSTERSLGMLNDSCQPLAVDKSAGIITQQADILLRNENGQRSSTPCPPSSDLVTEDIVKIVRSIKDSVSQSGGLTAEVKALVRELRGEVLGMGREIGRRLELANLDNQQRDDLVPPETHIRRAIEEGLEQLNHRMGQLIEAHQDQLATVSATAANDIDYQEVYNAMRAALRDSKASGPAEERFSDLDKEEIINAVRVAWEEHRPDIDMSEHGMAKEEILDFLKEGLQEYVGADERVPGATREEVFQAVVEGLKHFAPPQLDSAASLSRDELLGAVRECLEEFEFPVAPSAINAELSRDDMAHAVKEGLNNFEFKNIAIDDITNRLDDMAASIRDSFKIVSEEAKQNMAANGRDTEQVLDATKDGLERLHLDLEEYHQIMTKTTATGSAELLATVSHSLSAFQERLADLLVQSTDGTRKLVEERLGTIHESVNSAMVPALPQTSSVDIDILEAVKNGVDALRAEMRRPLAGTTEILDALHEGLADLRVSVDKVGNRPMDFTANDEILDALKAGLDGVRADIDTLREQGHETRAVAAMADNAVVTTEPKDILQHDDIKNLEVMIAQLRIKLEAMSPESERVANGNTASKDDISRLEEVLSQIAESVTGVSNKESVPSSGADPATREDVEAIETILRNTKAKLDDLIDGDVAVRREHIDSLHSLLEDTRGTIGGLGERFDTLPHKEQVTSLENSVAKVASSLDELRERTLEETNDPNRVTKANVEVIEGLCRDMKVTIDDNHSTSLAALASAEDIQLISATLDELRDCVNSNTEANSKAFEDRQAEIVGVGERLSDVKDVIDQVHDLAKLRFDEGATSLEALGKLLEDMLKDVSQTPAVIRDIHDLSDVMKAEFEESRAAVVGAKLDADEKFQQFSDGLTVKIDDKVAQLLSKYVEMQNVADERARAGEARDEETNQALLNTKAIADELKSLVDTLGVAVTDSFEKTEEASKTVFNKVEEFAIRMEENHADGNSQHQQTQDQVKVAAGELTELRSQIVEFQPKVLDAVKELLLIVGQHYEHSKASTAEIENKIVTTQKAEPLLLPATETYDDTAIQAKLDKLIGHAAMTESAFGQFEVLDLLHKKVNQTASELTAFLESQTKHIAEVGEDREKMLHETTIALERSLTQKEVVEANLASLSDEEKQLKQSIEGLKKDHEELARHKSRLAADVSSLETALRLRREELQDMEVRAEGLERRILEGVMDQSRILLMSKAARTQESMSRKRVRPQKPVIDTDAQTSTARSNVPIALSGKRSLAPPRDNTQARRILSLSQINNNTVSSGMKRSHSVRTPTARALRKRSWAGGAQGDRRDADKENASRGIDEESDVDAQETQTPTRVLSTIDGSMFEGDHSDSGTLRRSSHGTTIITDSLASDSVPEDDNLDRDGDFNSHIKFTEGIADCTATYNSLETGLVVYGGEKEM